jgi:putative membrane protein
MPSERRLHPLSFVFHVGGQLQQLVVPGLVLLVGAGSAGLDWQIWAMSLIIPSALFALLRCLSFRYRFDDTELVITSGFIFRKERHLPYGRVQNIDARQNLLHRFFRVVEVRIETGGGEEPEAAMRVLPLPALDEIRERVFAGRASATPDVAAHSDQREVQTLLELGPRDLLLAGFIDSRGMVIVGAAFGLLWELGLFDRTMDMIFGDNASGRGLARRVFRAVFDGGPWPVGQVLQMVLVFVAVLIGLRILSMVWSFIRLYGFRLERSGNDLQARFGLFTRVMANIPLHRIQTLTIREGPFHRLSKTVSVRVDSAGSDAKPGSSGAAVKRESLAPIVSRAQLPQLLHDVLPEIDLSTVTWQTVHPRAFRRVIKVSVVFYSVLSVPLVSLLNWWSLAVIVPLAYFAYADARLRVRHLGWALGDRAVLFRSGWLIREESIARYTKIQAVTLQESPFDRRHHMASVRVDTAGAGDASHRVAIPYLARETADEIYDQLSDEAARTSFRW